MLPGDQGLVSFLGVSRQAQSPGGTVRVCLCMGEMGV